MKVEANLTLVKGDVPQRGGPPRPPRLSRENSPPAVVLLISQENQEARRLDPASLKEAQDLLQEASRRLHGTAREVLAAVHLLESRCLVRLPE